MRPLFRRTLTILCVLAAACAAPTLVWAQYPKLPPCDSSALIAKAQPVFNAGPSRLADACPAFREALRPGFAALRRMAPGMEETVDSLERAWIGARLAAPAPAPSPAPSPAPIPTPTQPTTPAPAPDTGEVRIVFQDGFESGNLGARQGGVSWISAVYVDVTSAIAHSGTRAARFNQGQSREWSELRFGGLPNIIEAYVQFYLYMPSGKEQPSVGPRVRVLGSRNDKFVRLWGGDYNAATTNKVGASLWGIAGGDGVLGLEYGYTPPRGAQWGEGQGPNPVTAPFVNDQNRGRWLQIRIRAKTATAANNDGILQLWVDGKLLLSMTNMANYPGAGAFKTFTEGYLLGWANNGYPAGQVMYIDDFTISTGGFPR